VARFVFPGLVADVIAPMRITASPNAQ